MKKIVILYSGGLDSFIMAKLAESKGYDVKLVHYDIGQEYNKKEDDAIHNLSKNVEIRKVDWLNVNNTTTNKNDNSGGNIFIPGRNLTLALLVASTDLPDEIWMGGLKGEDHDRATDKNQKFIDGTNELIKYVFSPYDTIPKLVFPLLERGWGKYEAVKWAYDNGVSKEDLMKTSSCLYKSEHKNCGRCMVCCRRYFIFKQLGFEEEYETYPLDSKDNIEMVINVINDSRKAGKVHYNKQRQQEIIPGLFLEFKTHDLDKILKILNDKLKNIDN